MKSLKSFIKSEFEEYQKNGFCKEAKKMNDAIGESYFDIVNPHYFTGKPDSEIVTVMLNPQRRKEDYNKKTEFKDFETYWNTYRYYGRNNYGITDEHKPTWKSKFDLNQRIFFKQLDIIDYKHEKAEPDIFENLEKTIDLKLQWELVPYGSPNFNFKHIGISQLKSFISRTIDIVTMYDRKYVFFCGAVFRELAWFENVKFVKNHKFKLIKNNGEETRDYYELISIELTGNNKQIKAAILPQYARQGAPLAAYGKKVKELY